MCIYIYIYTYIYIYICCISIASDWHLLAGVALLEALDELLDLRGALRHVLLIVSLGVVVLLLLLCVLL